MERRCVSRHRARHRRTARLSARAFGSGRARGELATAHGRDAAEVAVAVAAVAEVEADLRIDKAVGGAIEEQRAPATRDFAQLCHRQVLKHSALRLDGDARGEVEDVNA